MLSNEEIEQQTISPAVKLLTTTSNSANVSHTLCKHSSSGNAQSTVLSVIVSDSETHPSLAAGLNGCIASLLADPC